MKASMLLEAAGIHCYPDSADVDHFRYTSAARRRAARFRAAQAMVIRAADTPGILAGRLVCLDLVRPSDLTSALQADVYGLRSQPCIEWPVADGTRVDRRALSCITALCLPRSAIASPAEVEAFKVLLRSFPDYQHIAAADLFDELERDLVCWAAQHLPAPLWAHVCGLRPMTALARHCASMADAVGVPRIRIDEAALGRRAEAADMLDTAIAAGRKATTPLLVELATKVFSVKGKDTDAETLSRWIKELFALRARVEAGDVATAAVIGWQIDLVESGTATEVNAAVRTRARYARVASLRLWRMLAALPADPNRWSPIAMNSGYLSMMADPACQDLGALGAAISSFQNFAEEIFGLPPLPLGLHKYIPEAAARAQWIAEPAVQRAIRWLNEDAHGDPRLKQICTLMILLAYAAPFRLSELRWLRLSNIAHTDDGTIEIEITALTGSSRLKSPDATRRLLISASEAIARLNAFIERREAEGAGPGALLFAAPDDDTTPYRSHAVHVTLLRVLKLATGNSAMTFHALRHTFISNAVEEILSSSSFTSNNRLSLLIDSTGHAVAVTTLKFYSHWFEFALRAQVDAALREHALTNADGERLLGTKANSLTIGARRRQIPLNVFLWNLAERRKDALVLRLPIAAQGLNLNEPQRPTFSGPLNRNFTIFHCLAALSYLVAGTDQRLIEHRMPISAAQLSSIHQAAMEVTRAIYATRGMLAPAALTSVPAIIGHLGLDLARVNQRRYDSLRGALALPQDVAVASAASACWVEAWRDGELSADPPDRLVPLLQFLKSADVTLDSLLLVYEDDSDDPSGVTSLLRTATQVATAVFHDHLAVMPLSSVRRGRARAHLVWPSRTNAARAGRSNAGFDALMFATAVWVRPEVQGWN